MAARAGVKDVARRAGVSVGTVSNVLNRPDAVATATRERVEAAMAELGATLEVLNTRLRTSLPPFRLGPGAGNSPGAPTWPTCSDAWPPRSPPR